jgi:predicted RNase H-like HicB family nuclease
MLQFYPVMFEGDDQNGYGAIFADFPGCVSSGDTLTDTARRAAEALALHVEGMAEDGDALPEPGAIEVTPDWMTGPVVARALVPVEVSARSVRVQVTINEGLLRRLDQAASAEGLTRSGYLAHAARERLNQGSGRR